MYIKKLVIHGFKSFPRKTEIPFSEGINVIIGSNGSGKSNITDSLCFVLGRLSIKSMRAARAKNLIFLGNKFVQPSKEASVEVVFDNSNNIFSLPEKEISIRRIVRKNGQSIYKINHETKTRQEILTLLAQAGIDPNGFNIILQGEIQNFVRMHTEERRKIIEEVSGISVYESRKEKSIKELEKTEEKLKEITIVLRDRTAYLNNLEKERQQALRYKKLEQDIRRYKASILQNELDKNKKESEKIYNEILKRNKEIEKIRKLIITTRTNIENCESKINLINKTIQESTGLEQEKLNQEIANLRAELAGLGVRLENFEEKISSILKEKSELQGKIKENEISIKTLKKSPETKKEKEIAEKKQELEKFEEERKKFYMLKSSIKSLKERIQDRHNLLQNYNPESDLLLRQIKSLTRELYSRNTTRDKLDKLKIFLSEKKHLLQELLKKEKELEKISYANESEIDKQIKLTEKISKMDICPLCKSKITEDHINSIHKEIKPKIDSLKKEVEASDKELSEIYSKKSVIEEDIEQINQEISHTESDIAKISSIEEKKSQIKNLQQKIEKLKAEISELLNIQKNLEKKFEEDSNIEKKYETLKMEIQEISLRTHETVDSEIDFNKRELDRAKISLKQLVREEQEFSEEIKEIKGEIEKKEDILNSKKLQEQELTKKFQQMISERDAFNKKIRELELESSSKQNNIYNLEQENNNLKVERAKFNAIIENLETDLLVYHEIEIIRASKDVILQKLAYAEETLRKIGSVNLKALEVYDSVKKEYDGVKDKMEVISKEKENVLKIIHEIDIKKKKTFLKTLDSLNSIFSRNFSQLSTKGQVWLELENKKNPFEGGVGITVKTGHGKYFDVTSLSGGEQTIVALSLIFAIQELSPYYFYVLDEIDAALDKRNSQRLAGLLNKYMKKGQYIVITHNDEVISNATNLYGISMNDGISKIVSLKV